ncbi:MAG: class IV adenylate cyclase [Spirochaetae bacterium HGW-Spirochaetae-7]|jgi:adenylate cyclase class 2|nr:MAG: class IV adenylate cyclase [Spirochaetae bacterium HGW-Spirochaetae-7]
MLEIELKARVRDKAAVEAKVGSFARFLRSFDKFDEYWHGPLWRDDRGARGFRLRKEGESCVVTFKRKNIALGIELNHETEFEVSDAAAFEALVERIGCEPFYSKRKTGKAWDYRGCTIEILDVVGLGSFIEIERLLEHDDPSKTDAARKELLSVLSMAGIPESDIETRRWSEMLFELKNHEDNKEQP